MGATHVNCQPRKTSFEQCSQLFCFQLREIHRPTFMEYLSSQEVFSREWDMEGYGDATEWQYPAEQSLSLLCPTPHGMEMH